MKKVLIGVLFSALYLFANNDVKQNNIELTNSFVGKTDTKIVLVRKMIDVLKRNVALKKVNVSNVVVFHGTERSYTRPFYKIANESLLLALKQLNVFNIQLNDTKARLQIIATPTSLKISKVSDQKMEEQAQFYGADAIFIWDIFEFEGKMTLLAKIVEVNTHTLKWSFQVNENQIQATESLQKDFKKQFKIPKHAYLIAQAGVVYSKHTYTAKNDIKTFKEDINWIGDLSLEYLTTSAINPLLNFGVVYNYESFIISDYSLSYHSILVDFRYQLNAYTPPIYDFETGKIFLDRNHPLYTIGVAFGPTLIYSTDARKNKVSGVLKVYFNTGITEDLEYNAGIVIRSNNDLSMKDNGSYKDNIMENNIFSLYMSVGYKFSIGKE